MYRSLVLLALVGAVSASEAACKKDIDKLCKAMKEEGDDRYDDAYCSANMIKINCGIWVNMKAAADAGDETMEDQVESLRDYYEPLFDEYNIKRTFETVDPNADFVIADDTAGEQPQDQQEGAGGEGGEGGEDGEGDGECDGEDEPTVLVLGDSDDGEDSATMQVIGAATMLGAATLMLY